MAISYEEALVISSNFRMMTDVELACKIIDERIIMSVLKYPELHQVSIPNNMISIVPNTFNWNVLCNIYRNVGWDILTRNKEILLVKRIS